MIYLVIISLCIVAAYTAAVCIKLKKVPESLSSTFYALGSPWWFSLCMFLTGGLLMPAILEITPETYQFTAFLACAGLLFVAAAPHFREDLEREVHVFGAVMCIGFSQIWVLLTCPWWLMVWAAWLIYTVVGTCRWWNGNFKETFKLTNPMFWVEVAALASTYGTLGVELLNR